MNLLVTRRPNATSDVWLVDAKHPSRECLPVCVRGLAALAIFASLQLRAMPAGARVGPMCPSPQAQPWTPLTPSQAPPLEKLRPSHRRSMTLERLAGWAVPGIGGALLVRGSLQQGGFSGQLNLLPGKNLPPAKVVGFRSGPAGPLTLAVILPELPLSLLQQSLSRTALGDIQLTQAILLLVPPTAAGMVQMPSEVAKAINQPSMRLPGGATLWANPVISGDLHALLAAVGAPHSMAVLTGKIDPSLLAATNPSPELCKAYASGLDLNLSLGHLEPNWRPAWLTLASPSLRLTGLGGTPTAAVSADLTVQVAGHTLVFKQAVLSKDPKSGQVSITAGAIPAPMHLAEGLPMGIPLSFMGSVGWQRMQFTLQGPGKVNQVISLSLEGRGAEAILRSQTPSLASGAKPGQHLLGAAPTDDPELNEAQAFLNSLDELETFVEREVTKRAPGLYQVNTGIPAIDLFLVKQQQWFAVVRLPNPSNLPLQSFLPSSIIGQPAFTAAILVFAKTQAVLQATLVPQETTGIRNSLVSALALSPTPTIGIGVNLFAPFAPGDSGVFGQLKRAGVLPANLLLEGTITRGFSDQLFGTYGLKPRHGTSPDLTVALKAVGASFVPLPFTLLTNPNLPFPKLTFGAFELSMAGTATALTLSGQQTNSTVTLGRRTVTIPSTSFTYTKQGEGYIISVAGAVSASIPTIFGLPSVDLDKIGVIGTISSQQDPGDDSKKIKGFGLDLVGWVRVNNNPFQGNFSMTVTNNQLTDLSLYLQADLALGFMTALPHASEFSFRQVGLGLDPTHGSGYFFGTLDWANRGSGTAALVLSNDKPTLFVHLLDLKLADLMKQSILAGLPVLKDALVVAGAAANLNPAALPAPVATMINSVAGTTSGQIPLANGLTVLTRLDASTVPGSAPLAVSGPILLAGDIDFTTPSMTLLAALTTVKTPSLKGFGIQSPQFLVSLTAPNGVPTLAVGLRLSMTAPINGDSNHPLKFHGDLTAATNGTLSMLGSMDSDWVQPLGLKGITVKQPAQLSFTLSETGSISIGMEAGVRVASAQFGTQTFDKNAICLTLQPIEAPPFVAADGFGLQLKASTLGVGTQVALWAALIESVTKGPMAQIHDQSLTYLRSFVGEASDVVVNRANALPISQFTFNNAVLTLQTPTAQCAVEAFAKGMQAHIKGNAVFGGNPIAEMDSYFNLVDGLKLYGNLDAFKFGPQGTPFLTVNQALIDVLVPTPGNPNFSLTDPGHFIVKGNAAILGHTGFVTIIFNNKQATLALAADLADLGKGNFLATTVGPDFAHLTDFKLAFDTKSNLEGALLKKLGAALQASSAAHKADSAKASASLKQRFAEANQGFQALDGDVGEAFRKAQALLDACTREFGKGAVGCQAAQVALDKVKQLAAYGTWQRKKAIRDAYPAAKGVLDNVMKGWDVMDAVSAKLLAGAANNLIRLDEFSFDGHINTTIGKLAIGLGVGSTTIRQTYEVNVGALAEKAVLDLEKQAEAIAKEIEKEANQAGSAVQNLFN